MCGCWDLGPSENSFPFSAASRARALIFEVVSYLHACAGRAAVFGAKLHFRMSLAAVDREAANIHVHGAHIQSADGIQVLQDARADGRAVTCLLLARAGAEEPSGESQG